LSVSMSVYVRRVSPSISLSVALYVSQSLHFLLILDVLISMFLCSTELMKPLTLSRVATSVSLSATDEKARHEDVQSYVLEAQQSFITVLPATSARGET
jgi:hypothetical protein